MVHGLMDVGSDHGLDARRGLRWCECLFELWPLMITPTGETSADVVANGRLGT